MERDLINEIKKMSEKAHYEIKSTSNSLYTFIDGLTFEILISYSKKEKFYNASFSCKPYLSDDLFWKITENKSLSKAKRITGAFTVPEFRYDRLERICETPSSIIIKKLEEMVNYFKPTQGEAMAFHQACFRRNETLFKRNYVLNVILLIMAKDKQLLLSRIQDFKKTGFKDGFSFVQADGNRKSFTDYAEEYIAEINF